MPKPPNLIPSKQLNVALPLPLLTQLNLELYSELEGRVPHGAYSRFLVELIRRHFAEQVIDIGPRISPHLPSGVFLVRGEPSTLELLEKELP